MQMPSFSNPLNCLLHTNELLWAFPTHCACGTHTSLPHPTPRPLPPHAHLQRKPPERLGPIVLPDLKCRITHHTALSRPELFLPQLDQLFFLGELLKCRRFPH